VASKAAWVSAKSFATVRLASQYMMPVGTKKNWKPARPTA
jgi:hypothetical protein